MTRKVRRRAEGARRGAGGGRGRPRSEKAERAILDATLDLLAEAGVSGFTVEAVAAKAGVSKATIYRRWTSKLPLVVDAIMTLPEIEVPDGDTLENDVRRLLRNLVRILRGSPLGRVLPRLVAEHGADADLDEAVGRYLGARRQPLVDFMRRRIERREIAAGIDADVLPDLLVGPVVNRLLFARRPITERFLDLVVEGVLATASAPGARRRPAGAERR